jgi:hypothetical protein
MKRIVTIILSLAIISCKQKVNNNSNVIIPLYDTVSISTKTVEQKHDSIYNQFFEQDSTKIPLDDGDTMKITKRGLLLLEKQYPDFFSGYLMDPDASYAAKKIIDNPDSTFSNFDGLSGMDDYFEMYCFFLSIRNGEMKYVKERKSLIDIYLSINYLHEELWGGGSYYRHMYKRVGAYAEYDIRLLEDDSDRYKKNYDFRKQKELFIQSIKQYVLDEARQPNGYSLNPKSLFEIIKDLNTNINSYFLLSKARQFEYTNYYR